MPIVTLVDVAADASDFQAKMVSAVATAAKSNDKAKVYLMITTAHEAGKPWCGDCVAAENMLSALFQPSGALEGDTMVLCPLARATYRQPGGHPFKRDPLIKLTAVPTLYKWDVAQSQVSEERLVEGETYEDHGKVKAFLGLPESFSFPQ